MNELIDDEKLEELCEQLDYAFKDTGLLKQAFMHSSFANEHSDDELEDNERLEFLGDAVLDLVVSDFLMKLFDKAREGDLSKFRASIVNERGLHKVARGLKLGDYILLGKGELITRGHEKPSILSNTLEALIGAIYLDGGFDVVKKIVHDLFRPFMENIDHDKKVDDFKSLLQEYSQNIYKTRPEYVVVAESGPAHDRTFVVALRLKGDTLAQGEGRSKKAAEQNAAREAYLCLTENEKET